MSGKMFYVIADIHGRLDLLTAALARIHDRSVGVGGAKVIFLGDFVDRGPESRGVVARLMAGPPKGGNWRFVRGNHEDMLLECVKDASKADWWIGNGGGETLASYGGDVDGDHLAWMDALPRLLWDEHRVYVHAGVEECYDLDEQPEAVTQWSRYPRGADIGHRGRHVVHGHTPCREAELFAHRTNLDTGAVFTGLLTVGVFRDDRPGGPVEIIEVRA